jgi:WD40 repeat protein
MHFSAMRLLQVFLALLAGVLPSHAALSGRLVYIQDGAAYVLSLPNGKPKKLPDSHRARLVFIAPTGGTVLYFSSKKGDGSDERGWISKPPYKTAQSLKLPKGFAPYNVQWTRDGTKALLAEWDRSYLWHMPGGALKALPAGELALSRDGRLLAVSQTKELRLRDLTTGKERTIFSLARPKTVLEALKRARYPQNLKELNDAVSPDLWKDTSMWSFGSCAFAGDNSRLFWTCNAGTGAGAAGNTTFCWFATDLKTNRTEVLSKLGAQFSRLPYGVQLSPDGKKLLYGESVHSSAVENPVSVSILDLLTQKETYLEELTDKKNFDMNLVSGFCWSPDGRAVAASAFYYDADTIWKKQAELSKKEQSWEPRDSDYTLFIRDLNNRTLKKIPGAVSPQWGR